MTDPDPLMRGQKPKRPTVMFSPRILGEMMDAQSLTLRDLGLLLRKRANFAVRVEDILDGKSRPGPEALYAIAEILGCAMEDLLEEKT